MLLRKFIRRRLADYYAQPSNKVVGTPPKGNIDFTLLLGEWHWRWLYRRAYRQQEGQWLTPVELFKPYYSNSIANFVSQASMAGRGGNSSAVHVVELGGGRGTNASLILSHLRMTHPEVYDRLTYTIFDASPTLLELQKELLSGEGHGDKVDFVQQDMTDIAENNAPFLTQSDVPTIAVSLELLDNLAHDKISRCKKTRELQQAEIKPLHNASADENDEPGTQCEEVFAPLTDSLLKELVDTVPAYASGTGSGPKWVPSVACGVLRRLFRERPNSSLLMADFDWLPPPELGGESVSRRLSVGADGEPLITCMNDADHACYLTAPELCDILFPTDFPKLAEFIRKQQQQAAGRDGEHDDVQVMKQAEFLTRFGPEQVDQTKSRLTGFTPLLYDFSNYSVIASLKTGGTAKGSRRRSKRRRRNG